MSNVTKPAPESRSPLVDQLAAALTGAGIEIRLGPKYGPYRPDLEARTPTTTLIFEIIDLPDGAAVPSHALEQVASMQSWLCGGEWVAGQTVNVALVTRGRLTRFQADALEKQNIDVWSWPNIEEQLHSLRGLGDEGSTQASRSEAQLAIIDDGPVSSAGDDLLSFRGLASTAADLIIEGDGGISVGILGEWGSGKSSLMRLIQERLQARSEGRRVVRTVWFNPWAHQYEVSPVVALLKVLQREAIAERWISPNRLQTSALFRVLATVAGRLALGAAMGSMTAPVATGLLESNDYAAGELVALRLQEHFAKAVDELVGENGRLVIFIDDLDRCVPQLVIRVLELPQLYLRSPKSTLVIGMDADVVGQAVRSFYGTSVSRPEHYLEKIVQLQIHVPAISTQTLGKFAESLSGGVLTGFEDLLALGVGRRPRQIKRAINRFVLGKRLAMDADTHVEDGALLKLVLIQTTWPDFFARSVRQPEALTSDAVAKEMIERLLSEGIAVRDPEKLIAMVKAPPHIVKKEVRRLVQIVTVGGA